MLFAHHIIYYCNIYLPFETKTIYRGTSIIILYIMSLCKFGAYRTFINTRFADVNEKIMENNILNLLKK